MSIYLGCSLATLAMTSIGAVMAAALNAIKPGDPVVASHRSTLLLISLGISVGFFVSFLISREC